MKPNGPECDGDILILLAADGKPFFVNSQELAGAPENKIARPSLSVS